ncbi:MAG TPA: BTAD domain-containing putative transcriptional regulator [Gaiellaceae bacterium]
MDFRILGPLEVADDGRTLPLGRGRQRALLGLLLVHANEVVGQERLVDELWGESPPPTALTALHGYVSRLRKLLGPDRLQTRPPGYLLRVEKEELDLHRFQRLAERQRYSQALELWRGPALGDLAFEPFAQTEIERLEELRLTALEGRLAHDLAEGRHAEVVAELEALVHEHPLRERFAAQLMLALYRSGRQAEALDVYRVARARLIGELGLEPGEELRRLERRILEHDPALVAAAPAARRRDARLPAPATSFVGRVRELEQVQSLVARADVRLLTLTGAGGTGKTRLALEAARTRADEFADGAAAVPLGAISDPALVASAAAQALGVHQSQGQTAADALKDFLRDRELLLLLDNLEHLLDATPLVSELLASAPGLTVLATSRVHLNLYGEFEYSVPPLSLADEAIALFVQRAQAVRPDFELSGENAQAIAEICRRVDGLPLAIELAAARIRTLAPAALLEALGRRLDLLTDGPRDVPARQRTLRDTIAWSYDLLSPLEQTVFVRLAAFAGGCSVPAAEAVCGGGAAEALASLAGQNLVVTDDESRYAVLETIREFALERLAESTEGGATRDRHARFFLAAVEDGGPNRRGDERTAWLEGVDRELENVRAALTWCAGGTGGVEVGLRTAAGLIPYWMARGYFVEAVAAADALLARSKEPTVGRARALVVDAMLAVLASGDLTTGATRAAEAVELTRRVDPGWFESCAVNIQATVMRFRGRYDDARTLYEEALRAAGYGELWWPASLAWANIGFTAFLERRYDEAAEVLASSVHVPRDAGDGFFTAVMQSVVGRALARTGDLVRAGEAQREALREFLALGNSWGVISCLGAFALLAHAGGDDVAAARLIGAEAELRRRAGVALWLTIEADHARGVAAVSSALGEEAFAQHAAEGATFTQDEAVAYVESLAQVEPAVGA